MCPNGNPLLQGGFSLVEVLVAAVVFSFGVGGLSLMLMTSVHGTIEARNQTTARVHVSELAELILMNPSARGHYITPPDGPMEDCMAPDGCSDVSWAAGNLVRWQQALESNLARSAGVVCLDSTPDDGDLTDEACDGSGHTVVKVFWAEPFHLHDTDGGLRRVVLPLAQ